MVRPAHLSTQAQTFAWLADAHTRAEAKQANIDGRPLDEERFHDSMVHALLRFGCGPDAIATRAHDLPDCSHTLWSEMQIYRLHERPMGLGALARTQFFTLAAEGVLHRLYAACETPPTDLLHVTCTGYDSPSAAQRMVAKKAWRTRVFHVYHMGCYAAFPALRAAIGLGTSTLRTGLAPSLRSDIVHTEICSLHINPLSHTPEQWVVQTLFADGFIAYGVRDEASWDRRSPALLLLAQDEQMIPDSTDAMTWSASDFGMQMALSRTVPNRIADELGAFVDRLALAAGIDRHELQGAVYAVHPGGPKILDRAREVLQIGDAQLASSRKVLLERGNMSSATLPHIWMELLEDREIAAGRLVVSLAFGPGLTICGAIMRKVME
jgi:predicted naringenin-chalcone synthase